MFVGHDPVNLVGARYVVISTAVKAWQSGARCAARQGLADHPARRNAGRADAALFDGLGHRHARQDDHDLAASRTSSRKPASEPTVITGGIINDWGSNARLGHGKWMIVEADESDGTFIAIADSDRRSSPTSIPSTSTTSSSVENMHREFETFLTQHSVLRPGRRLHRSSGRARHDRAPRSAPRRSPAADLRRRARMPISCCSRRASRATRPTSMPSLDARVKGGARTLEGWSVPLPGAPQCPQRAGGHRGRRREAGIDDDVIRAAMAGFSGVKRRFQLTGDLERRRHLRRLRSSPGRDRGRARRPRGRRTRTCHRRRRAASLHARARSLRRVCGLLQGRRQRHRHAALFGGRSVRSRASTTHRWPRHPRRPDTASVAGRRQRAGDLIRRSGGRRGRATSSSVSGAGNSTEWAHALPDWLARASRSAAGSAA